jgi:hypothetical protein
MFRFGESVAEGALSFFITVRETNKHQLIKETFLLSQSVDEQHILHFIVSTIISSLLRKAGAKIKKI